ncbi:H(+)-transporting V1 sector ATPase subunit H [Clavispora lusitaniae]|nr:H(+)-transporting V1 sector ATPase subunit H [Clavispora lusitaniae]
MASDSVLVIDSSHLSDSKKLIREKIIPWEGLARAGIITNDQADLFKVLEAQNAESKRETILSSEEMYTKTILNLLNKLDVNSRDDVLKSVLVLINDLLVDEKAQSFCDALLSLSSIDSSLPYNPFIKHLENNDSLIKTLSFYNLVILLSKSSKAHVSVDKEILIKLFDLVCSPAFIGNPSDRNLQSIGVQFLQELVIRKEYRTVFQENNLVSNFKSVNELIDHSAKQPNATNLQLLYNALMCIWILSFSSSINKVLVHNFPQLVGNLLTISKDGIKLKVVRVAVSTLKNFISVVNSNAEQFSVVKLVLFHDGLNVVKTVQTRKFASNGSDEELSNDLQYLSDTLSEVVTSKLTSLDEYLVELENPNLLSWSSPTHKSSEFWQENAYKFKDSNYALVKKILSILMSDDSSLSGVSKVILLNDLQFLIKNLGSDLITFINSEKNGQYKLLIMNFLENNGGNNELKYEALRTIQYLVGHA